MKHHAHPTTLGWPDHRAGDAGVLVLVGVDFDKKSRPGRSTIEPKYLT